MKKQILFLLLFSFLSTFCDAQDYKKVDAVVLGYPKNFSSTQKLAQRIATDFTNDFEKVRAAYTWIANNVVYDPTEFNIDNEPFKYSTKAELEILLKKSEAALSSRVLSKKKAVCQGYSTLFKAICNELNIPSRLVTGKGKTIINDIGKKHYSDHAWNIVTLGNKEYLIDVTWGAGTYSNRFEKKLNYVYFLSSPYLFIKDHYPDLYADALLKEKIGQQEFSNGPIYYNYDFKLLEPTNGILKKATGGKMKFRFAAPKEVMNISYISGGKSYNVTPPLTGNNLEFEIDLSRLKKEKDLVLFFDYDAVVGFKLE
jgi:transglutaminase/protease-like cytokinesis protein 3